MKQRIVINTTPGVQIDVDGDQFTFTIGAETSARDGQRADPLHQDPPDGRTPRPTQEPAMSHTISVEHGHVTVTCTRCETVIVVPEQDDPAIAGLQALELHLYHLTTHHEKAE